MRWDGLFGDLEAQAAALEIAVRAGDVEARMRSELSRLQLINRLRAAVGNPLRIRCVAGETLTGALLRVGAQWLLVEEAAGREALVALDAVLTVAGLGSLSAPADSVGAVESRLGLAHALRGVARDRSGARITLVDGSVVNGTVDRVGADFVEVAIHPAGEMRRRSEVRDVVVIAISAIAVVRRDGQG